MFKIVLIILELIGLVGTTTHYAFANNMGPADSGSSSGGSSSQGPSDTTTSPGAGGGGGTTDSGGGFSPGERMSQWRNFGIEVIGPDQPVNPAPLMESHHLHNAWLGWQRHMAGRSSCIDCHYTPGSQDFGSDVQDIYHTHYAPGSKHFGSDVNNDWFEHHEHIPFATDLP